MKKLILPFTIILSFLALSCEPEEIEFNGKAKLQNDIKVYSDTGDQSDPDDKKGT